MYQWNKYQKYTKYYIFRFIKQIDDNIPIVKVINESFALKHIYDIYIKKFITDKIYYGSNNRTFS